MKVFLGMGENMPQEPSMSRSLLFQVPGREMLLPAGWQDRVGLYFTRTWL